ncbi:glutaredoxin-like protein NrdH [Chlamydia trachomatis]|nr:glutaredoxin-like protein NrdH [Chlamydia trachomatis]
MITVFTKDHCPQCKAVKTVLENTNTPYQERPINAGAMLLAQEKGFTSAPIVVDSAHALTFCGYNKPALQDMIEVNKQ